MVGGLAAVLLVLAGEPSGAPTEAAEPAVRDISGRRELFVDDWLIESLKGAALTLHSPTPAEVVLRFDQPWASPTIGFTVVMKDEDRYRLYYTDDSDGARPDFTGYAESPDGVHWTTPKLGLFEFAGSKDNNIVWAGPGMHNFNPFRDANPKAAAEERYKALGGGPPRLFASPDGIHWKMLSPDPVLTDGRHDSQNLAFWDSQRGLYVAYARYSAAGVRHIRTATSEDFIHWSPSQPIDIGEAPREHLYTNAVTPYFRAPHIYVGFPMRFVPSRQADPKHPNHGVSDGVLITSRDGLHFDRRFLEAFIRPDIGIENWTDRTNLPTWGVVQTGPAEMSVYWVEHFRHPTVRLRRGTLRLDGFASVRAAPSGGEFVTRPLRFKGARLQLNYQTSAPGSVRVAVLDREGKELPGLGLAECSEIYGNELDRVVTWKQKDALSRLAGQTIRLRFVMQDADLYALQFVP